MILYFINLIRHNTKEKKETEIKSTKGICVYFSIYVHI